MEGGNPMPGWCPLFAALTKDETHRLQLYCDLAHGAGLDVQQLGAPADPCFRFPSGCAGYASALFGFRAAAPQVFRRGPASQGPTTALGAVQFPCLTVAGTIASVPDDLRDTPARAFCQGYLSDYFPVFVPLPSRIR